MEYFYNNSFLIQLVNFFVKTRDWTFFFKYSYSANESNISFCEHLTKWTTFCIFINTRISHVGFAWSGVLGNPKAATSFCVLSGPQKYAALVWNMRHKAKVPELCKIMLMPGGIQIPKGRAKSNKCTEKIELRVRKFQ